MQPLQAQPISNQAFPLLSYLDTVREARLVLQNLLKV